MVTLSNAHILIESAVANALFANAPRVSWAYYPQRKTLLVASCEDSLFKGLHKTADSILKYRNGQGDRSISVMELLIDNELDSSDRELHFTADETMKILSIFFE